MSDLKSERKENTGDHTRFAMLLDSLLPEVIMHD